MVGLFEFGMGKTWGEVSGKFEFRMNEFQIKEKIRKFCIARLYFGSVLMLIMFNERYSPWIM